MSLQPSFRHPCHRPLQRFYHSPPYALRVQVFLLLMWPMLCTCTQPLPPSFSRPFASKHPLVSTRHHIRSAPLMLVWITHALQKLWLKAIDCHSQLRLLTFFPTHRAQSSKRFLLHRYDPLEGHFQPLQGAGPYHAEARGRISSLTLLPEIG